MNKCRNCGLNVMWHAGFRVWFHWPKVNPRCSKIEVQPWFGAG